MNTKLPKSPQSQQSKQQDDSDKPLMRSLGEAVKHIWDCIKHDPTQSEPANIENTNSSTTKNKPQKRIIKQEVREEKRGKIILRETITREIEVKQDDDQKKP